jgi:hypothetical protein
LDLLKKHDDKAANKINSDFLKVLSKIYESRYHEGLSPGYNFVVVKRKFLAELDFTYSVLESKIRFKIPRLEKDMPKTLYEIGVIAKSPIIFTDNYVLNNINKVDFLQSEDVVFEFRILFNHELIEATYIVPNNQDTNKFTYEALTSVGNENKSFKISNHHPGIDKINVFRNGILQSMEIT